MAEDKYSQIEQVLLLEIQRREASGKPNPDDGALYSQLGNIYRSRKQPFEAILLQTKALNCLDLLTFMTPSHIPVFQSLANLYYETGNYAESQQIVERWLAFYEQLGGGNTLEAADLNERLAKLCDLQAEFSKADVYRRRSAAIREKS